ncbi:LPS export ABC transporter periplasmic protein LptC [Nereida sp.]|uniref:LPS export ABC transporter periplasmic protein LptC n=1 Tax=Nereida sp. TaxID=2736090 RepID=UPI003F69F6DA
MVRADNRYSRLVVWLKITLPIVGLVLLSLLFLVARPATDAQSTVPYAKIEIDDIVADQRISAPTYSGVTAEGDAIEFNAKLAAPNPDKPDSIMSEGISARIDLKSGMTISLTAPQASVDESTQTARLSGGIEVTTSAGVVVRTDAVTTSLETATLVTDGSVEATTSLGQITAGQMTLIQQNPGGHVLVFQNGVQVIYQP